MNFISLLTGEFANKAAQQLGVPPTVAKTMLGAAVPALLKGLQVNASKPESAKDLLTTLQKKHDGSILNNIDTLVNPDKDTQGNSILKHIFAGKKDSVIQAISKTAGVEENMVQQFVEMLAPAVMGGLGKEAQTNTSTADVQNMIQTSLETNPANNITGLITTLLDQDKDGSITDDLLNIGAKVLKKML